MIDPKDIDQVSDELDNVRWQFEQFVENHVNTGDISDDARKDFELTELRLARISSVLGDILRKEHVDVNLQ